MFLDQLRKGTKWSVEAQVVLTMITGKLAIKSFCQHVMHSVFIEDFSDSLSS